MDPYGFIQKERDAESGLQYLDRRFYSPPLGRFLSVDRMSTNGDWMWSYCYAKANPARFEDYMGLGPMDRVAKARSFIGTAYENETGKLRTEESPEGLKFMDCSELVSRVLAADGQIDKNQPYGTADLRKLFEESGKFTKVEKPEAGDIALWSGHTGVVGSVDKDENIKLIHASGHGKLASENTWYTKPEKYASGFLGYYRPVDDKNPGGVAPTPGTGGSPGGAASRSGSSQNSPSNSTASPQTQTPDQHPARDPFEPPSEIK
jgi:RHS repeat-associated protein